MQSPVMPLSRRASRAAFWTLSACAYTLAIWCTAVLSFGVHILSFKPAIHSWPKEAAFAQMLWFIASLALLPITIYFRESRAYVITGFGVWGFQLLWFFAFPVY